MVELQRIFIEIYHICKVVGAFLLTEKIMKPLEKFFLDLSVDTK